MLECVWEFSIVMAPGEKPGGVGSINSVMLSSWSVL